METAESAQSRSEQRKGVVARFDAWFANAWAVATDALLDPPQGKFSTVQGWIQRVSLAGLYLAGGALWTFFLNFGRFEWGVQDWIWEWRYARILQEAVRSWVLPLHTHPALDYNVSRFFGIPDVPLGPQILLLRVLDPGTVFLITCLAMYTVSYVGCLAIRRHFKLSVLAFALVSLLFNFNGFITAHLGIGHTLFIGYFLLPFYVLLLLRLFEDHIPGTWFAWMALVLFGIELQGTTQLYAAGLMVLAVILLFSPPVRWQVLKSILAAVGLCLFRIAPTAISLPGAFFERPLPGHQSLAELLAGLVWIIPAGKADTYSRGLGLGWWEFDVYLGLLGALVVLFFGVYRTWGPQPNHNISGRLKPLGLAILVFAVLSVGYLYWPINYLPIPLFNLVHVPSRFFIIPLLVVGTLASVQVQAWLDRASLGPWGRAVVLAALVVFGHDLFQHARLWRVEHVFEMYVAHGLDLTLRIANQPDPVYTTVLAVSAALSLAALIYTVWVIARPSVAQP